MRCAAQIAAGLLDILARGLDLSIATARFIDSTFSHPSAAELSVLLADDAVPERDSLLELLFTPDEALQIELESRLELQPHSALSSQAVIAALAEASPAVKFRFPDGRGELDVVMTDALARRLVQGLGLERSLPSRVADAVAQHGSSSRARRVRVILRNARSEFTAVDQALLCALIKELDLENDEGCACLAFALELLAEFGGSSDLYAALAARKHWLARAVNHNRRLREHLARSNVETLLSQGQRLTWVDEDEARRQLGHIDRICVAAFGRCVPVEEDAWQQAFDLDGPPDMADIMRRLA